MSNPRLSSAIKRVVETATARVVNVLTDLVFARCVLISPTRAITAAWPILEIAPHPAEEEEDLIVTVGEGRRYLAAEVAYMDHMLGIAGLDLFDDQATLEGPLCQHCINVTKPIGVRMQAVEPCVPFWVHLQTMTGTWLSTKAVMLDKDLPMITATFKDHLAKEDVGAPIVDDHGEIVSILRTSDIKLNQMQGTSDYPLLAKSLPFWVMQQTWPRPPRS